MKAPIAVKCTKLGALFNGEGVVFYLLLLSKTSIKTVAM